MQKSNALIGAQIPGVIVIVAQNVCLVNKGNYGTGA
jgi:hypothetical protein